MSRGEVIGAGAHKCTASKIQTKKNKRPLDKLHQVWYNKSVKGKGAEETESPLIVPKSFAQERTRYASPKQSATHSARTQKGGRG